MGVFQPGAFSGGAEVVELGEGAVLEVGFGNRSVAGRRDGVEPCVPEPNEFAGCVGDGDR